MEWLNRSATPAQPANTQSTNHAAASHGRRGRPGKSWLRIVSVVLLFCITVLIVALVWSIVLTKPTPENDFVNTSELQAVFLNGGQVYFGNITDLNGSYLRMNNIYYLQVNQQVQPNTSKNSNQQINLVKLGCELHGPEDEMVINRDQVMFWENLKKDGQVTKAVIKYHQQNPNGQKCDQPAS